MFKGGALLPERETAHVWFVNTSSMMRWSHGRMVPLRLGITLKDCTLAYEHMPGIGRPAEGTLIA